MHPTIPCPDVPSLQRLLRGEVPPPDGESLYDHLAECDRCVAVARSFGADDVLTAAVRGAAADAPDDPSLAGLMAELSRRGPPGGPDDVKATVLSDTIPPFGEHDTGRESLDFLAPAEGPDEIGRLGGHRILKIIGSGGMGVVFHAEDPALQRPVALKAMKPALAGGASARRRFLGEGRAAAALRHDHIVPIYQVGEDRGVPFLTMPLLRGESLEDRLTFQGALSPAEVCRIGREIAEGLAAAHARGLVHRDVKPANVWLESDEDGTTVIGRVKILDFGLARPSADARLTQEGAIVGTPAYMAPEQAAGRPVDARADLFSLGCVLYHMATGELPFRGADAIATLVAVANERPRPPAEVNPAVPPALSALVMRLLAKAPADRPPSAREVAEILGRAETRAMPRRRGRRRRWALRALIAVLLLGSAAATAARVIVPTDRGEVSIETDDPDVEVIAKGERIVRIVDPKTGRSYQLDRDGLTLTRADDPGGLAVTLDGVKPVVLKRDGRRLVTLRLAGKAPDPPPEKVGEVRRFSEGLEAPEWRPRVAFTADGRGVYATSDGFPKALLRWDRDTGNLLSRVELPSHGGGGFGFAMSPDRRLMVMRHGDDELWVARAADDVVLNRFEGVGEVWSSAISPAGDRVAAGNDRGYVYVWDRGSGNRLWFRHTDQVNARDLAVSPDGATLAVGGAGLQLFEMETGKEVRRLAQNGCIECAFTKDGRLLAACKNDVVIWDWAAGTVVRRIARQEAHLETLALAPDELHLATAAQDGIVRWWDVKTGAEMYHFDAHPGGVLGVAVAPDGKHLLSGGKDGTVRLWRLPDADPAAEREAAKPPQDPEELRRFEGHAGWVCNALFHPDGRRVLSSSTDGTVRLWDRETGETLRVYGNLPGHVWGLALSADGKTMAAGCVNAAGGATNAVRLWDVETGKPRCEIPLPGGSTAVDWSPDGRLLVASGEDSVARVFDAASGKPLCQFKEHTGNIRTALFSHDGRYAFSASRDQSVRMWDSRTGKEVRRFVGHTGWVLALALSPDGRFLASGGDKTVRVWEVATGQQVHCFEGHADNVLSVAFSPDGRRILSGDFGSGLRLWDAETGAVLMDRTLTGTVEVVRFSSDGRNALFGGNDNLLRLWRLPDPLPTQSRSGQVN